MTAVPGVHPPIGEVRDIVVRALAEDLGPLGDLTTVLLPAGVSARAAVIPRTGGVLAGRLAAHETFAQVDPDVNVTWSADDGDPLTAGTALARVVGPLASILTAERTALNLLGHLSGIATLTRRYVELTTGHRTAIRDTRKTTPGLRALEKAAVRAGGGVNHRGSLSDGILLKDNHLAGTPMGEAVARARSLWPGRSVQVECDTAAEVDEALAARVDLVLLDNMDPEQVSACVKTVDGACIVEVSGGVTLETVEAYAVAGADLISVGALTHSAPVLDIGLDIVDP
ncbi:MAG: carboxylating nicotinate-nucleotide diphosphorylase [Actinobacteria bacterium]|nr:carboxylating nicotinate-nucleotide diphosphorylase [Actinomycetota bacterium]